MIYVVGLDIGSTYTKAIALDGDRKVVGTAVRRTGFKLAQASEAVRYRCGACAEEIVIDVDRTEGEEQRFVEDCPVCCRANAILVRFGSGGPRASAELE